MRNRAYLTTFALATLVVLLGAGVAGAQQSSAESDDAAAFSAAPGMVENDAPDLVLRNIRVAGSVLRERASSDGFNVSSSGGCIYNSGGSASGVFNTPVYLPQGVTVTTLRMYYNDTSASDSTAWFTIYDLNGAIVDEFSVSSTGSGGNGFNDSAAINHVVDYNVYSYVLNWRPVVAGTTMQLCGFRIFYDE